MVYEFTSAAAERKYFSDAERLAFKERVEIPQNVQVFAFRESEGNLGEVARATKPERLLQLFPASPALMSWPPPTTIDDEALDVLDTRFGDLRLNPAQG